MSKLKTSNWSILASIVTPLTIATIILFVILPLFFPSREELIEPPYKPQITIETSEEIKLYESLGTIYVSRWHTRTQNGYRDVLSSADLGSFSLGDDMTDEEVENAVRKVIEDYENNLERQRGVRERLSNIESKFSK